MARATHERTLLIGIGNEYRRDDGAGVVIARRLREALPAGATVREACGEAASLLDIWHGADRVFIFDAVSSGAPAGSIHRLDARAQTLPADFFNYSTHGFSLAEAVEMARVLGQLPLVLIIFGIEGADFGAGRGLSPDVERAVGEVLERVKGELGA